MGVIGVLNRPMFTEAEAARLLRVPQSTLHWWLEGGTRRGVSYPPVLREKATGKREVTWGEFVEAALLRAYRRDHEVPLAELRRFIDLVRNGLDEPYPLASRRPFVGEGPRLVEEAQTKSGLESSFCLVAAVNGQLVLLPPAAEFVRRVVWKGDLAGAWRPHEDPDSPVLMDPEVRFGRPAIKGISTVVLWEQVDAGADFDEVAELFDLTTDDVEWAWAYERKQPGVRAA